MPVLALPWGSRSITRTSRSAAARAAPRLIAVVVLPTPPFWLTIATMRGPEWSPRCCSAFDTPDSHELEDRPARVRAARGADDLHLPGLPPLGQFVPDPRALRKQGDAPPLEERRGIAEQARQRRHRPRGDGACLLVERSAADRLGARCMDLYPGVGGAGDGAQELRLALVALDQMNVANAHDRQHQPRKAGAAADVEHGA